MSEGNRLEDEMRSGTWGPVPWYLDPAREAGDAPEWRRLGFPLELRRTANAALVRLYPPEYVRALAAETEEMLSAEPKKSQKERTLRRFGGIVRLFRGITIPGGVMPLLSLGLDADCIRAWENPQLVARLQRHEQFAGAAFEVRLNASLRRAGGTVTAVPTGQTRTPDFLVEFEGRPYEVEAKLVGESDVDRFAELFQNKLLPADLMVPGFHVRLHGSDALAELVLDRLAEAREQLPAILQAFSAAATEARNSPRKGLFEAAPWGALELTPGRSLGSMENVCIPDIPPAKRAAAIASAIRRKLNQLSGNLPGIIVIGLFGEAQPDDIERCILDGAASAPDFGRKCRMVVLIDQFAQPDVEMCHGPTLYPAFYAFSPLRDSDFTRRDQRLAQDLASPSWRRAFPVDWEQRGVILTRHEIERPVHTMYPAGRLTLAAGPGATARITLREKDGSLEQVPNDEGGEASG